MCDQTEIPYRDGDVVWVKFGKCFWPGLVVGIDKLPEDVASSLKKKPIAVVQFFDEDEYEFVKNLDHISLYNGRRKLEFIKKGLDLFRNQKGNSTFMKKFPEDVKKAELLTGGNPNILTDPQLTPKEKPSYQGLFNDNKNSTKKEKAVAAAKKRATLSPKTNGRKSSLPVTPVHTPRPITHPRFVKGETDHDVRIRDQSATKTGNSQTDVEVTPKPKTDAPYKCQMCDFTSNRLNVIVLHSKFHAGEAATPAKGKGLAGKSKTPKARASLSSPVGKARTNAKTKSAIEEPTQGSSLSSSPKAVATPKTATKRKLVEDVDQRKTEDKSSPSKAKIKAKESPVKKSLKTPTKTVEKKLPKVTLGKRKLQQSTDKSNKKSKNDEEIRDQLLADWDDEDAEQEKKELEQIQKKKTIEEPVIKEPSCFDFDDSKDAILDSELEERAKKFVESRKIPREKVENNKDIQRSIELEGIVPLPDNGVEAACPEDFDKAIDNLLAETVVPELPQVPSGLLPDVVLASNVGIAKESQSDATVSVDHDYSARKEDANNADDVDTLDINSMPVVMTDDIVTEESFESELESIEMPKIDLVPNANQANTPAIVFSEGEIKMPTSVKSLVKAVRTSTSDRSKLVIAGGLVSQANLQPTTTTVTRRLAPTSKTLSKGIAAGKYIIVQSASGQTSRLTLAPTPNTTRQLPSTGGNVVILSKPPQKLLTTVNPGQQKLVAGSSLGQQRLLSTVSSGQQRLLTTAFKGQQKLLTTASPGQKLLNVTSTQQKFVTTLSSGQQKVLTVTPKQKFVTTTMSGTQKVLTLNPAQQKMVTVSPAQHKLLTGLPVQQQQLMTSSGQILTQVTQKSAMSAGGKFTPIRTLAPVAGKQSLGPRLTMQSQQTKVCLPSLQKVRPVMAPGLRTVTTMNPQSNTILIQSAQSGPLMTRPRQVRSESVGAKPIQAPLRPKILQSRSTMQSRIVIQKPNTTMGVVSGMQQVTGMVTQPQVIQKITQSTMNPGMISQPKRILPTVTRVATNQPKPVNTIPRQTVQYVGQKPAVNMPAVTTNNELISKHELPPLAPLQSSTIPSGNITLTLPQGAGLTLPNFQTSSTVTGTTELTSDQLAQVMASPEVSQMGEAGAGATYVLLTIDEAGNLQPYNNQSLITYDGSDTSGQTLYIDSSSLESGGDLENMILTIDNSSVGGNLNLGESSSSWMPSTSQDILAAALANTNVFQPEVSLQDSCVVDTSSLLSSIPSTLLLPSLNRVVTTAANVSETSLTLNQPIMSPLEVTSSVTSFRAPPPSVTTISDMASVYAPINESVMGPLVTDVSTSEGTPTYHPSMPLLSEETSHYCEVDESMELPLHNLPLETDQATHFTEAYQEGSEQVVNVTISNSVSYPQDTSNVDSLGNDLVSNALDNFLSNNAEPQDVPSKSDTSNSMPLLCDDPSDTSGGQGEAENNSGINKVASHILETVTDDKCDGQQLVPEGHSGGLEILAGDYETPNSTAAVNSNIHEGTGDSSGSHEVTCDSFASQDTHCDSSGSHEQREDDSGGHETIENSSGVHEEVGDSSNTLDEIQDISGEQLGTGDISGKQVGTGDNSGDQVGTGESSGEQVGTGDSSGEQVGTGESSGEQLGIRDSCSVQVDTGDSCSVQEVTEYNQDSQDMVMVEDIVFDVDHR